MSKPGNYTAYQQYKPLDNGTIQAVQHWSNFYEQKRQNDIAQAQKDKELQGKAEKEKQEKLAKWLSYDNIPMTGVENVDIAHAKIMASDRAELLKIGTELMNTDQFSERGMELQLKIDKIKQNPATIKGMVSVPLKHQQKYLDGVSKGELIRTPYNDNFGQSLKDAKFTRNNNGDPAFIIKDPKNPNEEIVLTEAEILNLEKLYPHIPERDWNKTIINDATEYRKAADEKKLIDEKNGIISKTSGQTPEEIRDIAESEMRDQNGYPTAKAIAFLAKKGIYDYDPKAKNKTTLPAGIQGPQEAPKKDVLDELIDQYENDITPLLKNKTEQERDMEWLKYKQDVKENNDNNYNKAQDRAVEIAKAKGKGEIVEQATLNDANPLPKKSKTGGYTGFAFDKNNFVVKLDPKGDNNYVVKTIWISPSDPNMLVVHANRTTKTKGADATESTTVSETTKTFNTRDNQKEVGVFAAQLGLTIPELREELRKKAGFKDQPKQPTQKGKGKPKPTSKKEDLRTKYKY